MLVLAMLAMLAIVQPLPIVAVGNWLGFGGWPILVLLWLFSFTLLSVPTEALATGYRVLMHSWLPSRFPYEAIQGIVHFGGAGQAPSLPDDLRLQRLRRDAAAAAGRTDDTRSQDGTRDRPSRPGQP
jgi:hypothetical protein